MSLTRASRMLKYVNYRMKITLKDSRTIVGVFLAFDRHMNMVLGDTEEFRRIKAKKGGGVKLDKEEKRALGLIILRGDSIVSMTVEGPPPSDDSGKRTKGGPGTATAANRGPMPPGMPPAGMPPMGMPPMGMPPMGMMPPGMPPMGMMPPGMPPMGGGGFQPPPPPG